MLVVEPGPFLSLAFEATVEKYEELEDCYILSTEAFDMNIAPAMSETILFTLEGGLFLSRKGIAITIELEEHSAEELLERYPGASKLINQVSPCCTRLQFAPWVTLRSMPESLTQDRRAKRTALSREARRLGVSPARVHSVEKKGCSGEGRLGISGSVHCQQTKIPCTLLESGFRLTAQDSPDEAPAFSCCGWIWLRTLELAPFTDVEILFPAWH